MSLELFLSVLALAAWLYLLMGRGGFWRANIRDDRETAAAAFVWPAVTAVIPARNEADVIGKTLPTLLAQDYPRQVNIVLVDDQSDDGTAEKARSAAAALNAADRLTVLRGVPLPPGWTGKLWAMRQGIEEALSQAQQPRYLLLTDADIAYDRGALRRLVARAESGSLVLASLMVKLNCRSFAERALVPAFVFFFQMLYPFAWVNRRDRKIAAAAGGCMLVRSDALSAAGGIDTIRASLIDDCALGRVMKRQGPIWLGLTDYVVSMREYPRIADIRRMVARSAYDQLNYSPFLLAGTVIAMTLTYVLPPAFSLFGHGFAQLAAVLAWALMALAFLPMVRFYGLPAPWAAALPAIASAYMVFTLDSALQHWRGKGGLWKGRVQARRVEAS